MNQALRNVRLGLCLSLLAVLAGFLLGGLFGGMEEDLKDGLSAAATEVLDEVYGGDDAAAQQVVGRAWTYHKRAHMHWGGIGAATLAVSLLLGTCVRRRSATFLSAALGLGAVFYPAAWLLAGRAAPALGGTAAGKDRYEFLFVSSAGLLILGTALSLVLVARSLYGRETTG